MNMRSLGKSNEKFTPDLSRIEIQDNIMGGRFIKQRHWPIAY
jgi:hypothetical protein